MDRAEGFPPHMIGFMKRKREKEKLEPAKPSKFVAPTADQDRLASHA